MFGLCCCKHLKRMQMQIDDWSRQSNFLSALPLRDEHKSCHDCFYSFFPITKITGSGVHIALFGGNDTITIALTNHFFGLSLFIIMYIVHCTVYSVHNSTIKSMEWCFLRFIHDCIFEVNSKYTFWFILCSSNENNSRILLASKIIFSILDF